MTFKEIYRKYNNIKFRNTGATFTSNGTVYNLVTVENNQIVEDGSAIVLGTALYAENNGTYYSIITNEVSLDDTWISNIRSIPNIDMPTLFTQTTGGQYIGVYEITYQPFEYKYENGKMNGLTYKDAQITTVILYAISYLNPPQQLAIVKLSTIPTPTITPTITPSMTSTITPTPTYTTALTSAPVTNNIVTIVGGVIGGIVVIALIITLAMSYRKKKQRTKTNVAE